MFRWFNKHILATVVAVILIITVPGYWRIEQAINKAEDSATVGQVAGASALEALDTVIAQREEARLNICLKDKKFAEAHNRLVIGIVTSAGTREIPPELQPAVDEQIVDVPDCSPEGIAAFYDEGG